MAAIGPEIKEVKAHMKHMSHIRFHTYIYNMPIIGYIYNIYAIYTYSRASGRDV